MALSFPRTLPCSVQSLEFDIARGLSTNRLGNGTTQVREMAEPRWRASYTYTPMGRPEFQAMQAWLDTARGGMRPFLGHDALKPYPLLYRKAALLALTRATGGSFDGTASASAVSAAGFTVGSLPAGFALRAGDMVGLVQSGRYGLYRIVEDATASGGGSVALTVEPRVNTALFGPGAIARFVRPACLMILDTGSVSASRTALVRTPISFSAVQVLA